MLLDAFQSNFKASAVGISWVEPRRTFPFHRMDFRGFPAAADVIREEILSTH